MEWLVPARIAPLMFLAFNAIPSYKRRHIIDEQARGSEELRAVSAKIKERVGPNANDYQLDAQKNSFTRAEVTYETITEKKVGGFTIARKRMRASTTIYDRGKIGDLVGIKRRI